MFPVIYHRNAYVANSQKLFAIVDCSLFSIESFHFSLRIGIRLYRQKLKQHLAQEILRKWEFWENDTNIFTEVIVASEVRMCFDVSF